MSSTYKHILFSDRQDSFVKDAVQLCGVSACAIHNNIDRLVLIDCIQDICQLNSFAFATQGKELGQKPL